MQPPESSGQAQRAVSHGLPKQHRLRRRAEYLAVQQGGRSYRSRNVVALVLPNELGISRLGITVSKRVGKAVARNLVKRRLREIFRKNRRALPSGVDLVLIARAGSPKAEFGALNDEVVRLFEKISGDHITRVVDVERGKKPSHD